MWYLSYQCCEYAMCIHIPLFYMHTYSNIQTHILFSLVALHSDCFVNSDATKKKPAVDVEICRALEYLL
jgi:hypothetical protein